MLARQPFARRIVIAFVVMTALVSGVFSLSIVALVHLIEEHLVSEELRRELDVLLHEDLRNGRPPRLDAATRFYASDRPEYAIPPEYEGLEEGFTERVDGDHAYYVYTRLINGQRYLLVEEQHEFEARERVWFNVVLAGFLLSVLGAWGLGWIMARKVMLPVSRLAQQVRHRDQLLPVAPPLAPDYADDEVGQLAAAFDSTLGHLREALERERLFTSDVSHELRTPLMVIATSCELLAQADLPPRPRAQVERIQRASQEMGDLVQTFLQLARDRADDTALAARTGLRQVADEQLELWGPLVREKGLVLETRVEGEDTGRYHPTLLRTVMTNLLRNATHYTEQGFVRLVLEDGGFRVEDSGSGIPAGEHARVFQPFVRGERARGEGLGLGLSLVKRICIHQGWDIAIESPPEGGSRFRVSLRAPEV